MTDKDNSLEAIFYRMATRQIPKQFHGRIMEVFRKAVGRHQKEGDGRTLQAEPRQLPGLVPPSVIQAHHAQMALLQSVAIVGQAVESVRRAVHVGAAGQQPPIRDEGTTFLMPEPKQRSALTLDDLVEASNRVRVLNGLAVRTPTRPRPVAEPKPDSISPMFAGLKVIPVPHLPQDTIAVSQEMYDRIKASEPEPTQ